VSKAGLKIISDAMESLGLAYSFMRFDVAEGEEAPETYFVGEYQEVAPMDESGLQETSFLLSGFSFGSWLALENAKEAISAYFSKVGGKTVIADDGSAVAVFYLNSLVVPTEDAELKRIQINLDVKEWSVK
jgi:alpha/beta superfamily hydrolase